MLRFFPLLLVLMATTASASDLGRWGGTLDVGAPDLVNVGAVYRPVGALRFHFAAGSNGLGPGGRVGVALKVPWDVGPVLAAEGGHFVESDATWLAVRIGGEKAALPVFERVGYSYANLRAGLEFGNPKATFYIHGGMSGIWAHVRGLQALGDAEAGEGTLTVSDALVRAFVPSARVGVIFYFKRKSS